MYLRHASLTTTGVMVAMLTPRWSTLYSIVFSTSEVFHFRTHLRKCAEQQGFEIEFSEDSLHRTSCALPRIEVGSVFELAVVGVGFP